MSLTIEGSKKERREYSVVRSRLLLGPGQSGIRVFCFVFLDLFFFFFFLLFFLISPILFDGILLSFVLSIAVGKAFSLPFSLYTRRCVFLSLSLSGQKDGQVAVCNVDSSPYSFLGFSLNLSE